MLSSLNFEINHPPMSSASLIAIQFSSVQSLSRVQLFAMRASLIVELVKNPPTMQETPV